MTGMIIFPDRTGDTTLSWDDDHDAEMRKIITAKMKEGYSFFVWSTRKTPGLPNKKTKITKLAQVKENSVVLSDSDFVRMISEGKLGVNTAPPTNKSGKATRAKNADEVVGPGKKALAVKPPVAG